jgi:formylglycine-generating enzyme required for sulfatase activity
MMAISRLAVMLVVLLTAGCPDMSPDFSWRDAGIDDSDVEASVMSWKDAGIDADTDTDADGDAGGESPDIGVEVPLGWEFIPSGSFLMGSPEGELGRANSERQHEVTLTRGFVIQTTEVTQSQFADLMGYNNSQFAGCDDCPVDRVTWHEAAAYSNALSGLEDLPLCYECDDGLEDAVRCTSSLVYSSPYDCPGYRLPTEAEWEYAARAGEIAATYYGNLDVEDCSLSEVLNPIAWYCGNSEDTTHAVRRLAANAWGLYDMLGNVKEWCHDLFVLDLGSNAVTDPVNAEVGSVRSVRGGSWASSAQSVRAASRPMRYSADRVDAHGIRPVRTIPAGATLIRASVH